MSRRGPWYESENPSTLVRGASWRAGVWIICALIVCVAIGAVWWAISVATAPVRGAGDVYRQNNSGQNRIYAQAHFQDLYADIESYKVQINQAAQDKADHPGDSFYTTTYTGLFNTCVSAVNQYNADSGKALFTDWKAAGLPERIDAQVCQPSQSPTPTPSH